MCYPPQDYVGTIPADTRGRTIVVAASNSIDPTLAPAAYRCDGVDDQVEINNAITALGATGGTVILLEGQYNITASINLASLTTLMGEGAGTVLKIPNAFNADLNVISASSKNRVLVADLRIDGNKANQTAGTMYGIYFDTVTYSTVARCLVENLRDISITLSSSSNYNTITSNTCKNSSYNGIRLQGSSHNTVTGNTCQGNLWGIHLDSSSDNTIAGNTCQGNTNYGIRLYSSSNNTITGNTCQGNTYQGISLYHSNNNNTIAGNSCNGNGTHSIHLEDSCNNNTITGNTCQGNSYRGITLFSSSNYNTITSNTCQGNNREGINVSGSNNNNISSNTVEGNSQAADNTYDGIFVYNNSDYNNIQGNTVRHAGGANQHRYGINISAADCDGSLVINNDLYLAGRTADYNDAGTGTIYHNNRTTAGWVA